MEKLNVADLVASIKQETADKNSLKKTASEPSMASRMSGSQISKQAEDANTVAAAVAKEIGMESNSLSEELEKVAGLMSEASTTEDIIKIASSLDNSDLAHLSTIASKLSDVVYADLQNRING